MSAAVTELARIEARRMVRHPAPWLGIVLSVLMGWNIWDESWSGQRYTGLVAALTPMLLGISIASVSAFGRELVPVAEAAPLSRSRRATARLIAGLPLVGAAAVVVAIGATWLRSIGGVPLGDDPGRTLHAHHTLPELVQPVLLAALALVLGAVAVRLLRQRLAASIVLAVGWFLVGGTYWIFGGGVLRWLAVVQVQPFYVNVGPVRTDPATFPADWLLSAPGQYQDHWARVVVSPLLALWHDVYLVGLVLLLLAVVLSGRARRLLAVAGLVVALAGVALQHSVAPADDGRRVEAAALGGLDPDDAAATPIVVDTDLAGDDLAALAFLLHRTDVHVQAVTIAGTGLVGCDPGVDLVADLVLGLGDSPVPVACGREDPVRPWPEEWVAQAEAGSGLPRLDTTFVPTPVPASEVIGRLAMNHDGLRVVALGPLTNLGDLATDDPAAYARIAGITSMAGAVEVPAVDGVAEWNAAADPDALATVLAGRVPLTVVPDDAIPTDEPPVGSLFPTYDPPKWWDTSTAATSVEPGLATLERGSWTVDESGRLHRTGPGPVQVATELDPARLRAVWAATFG
ncbi:MAG TPA: nucleoside hydrolase [Nocardioides sp.]|nr:nucleoside hydrolase [Nocardioides sp.]